MLRAAFLFVLLLPAAAWSDNIWLCQDLTQHPEFSSIQCAPDAKVYVPSRINAGGAYSKSKTDDPRYRAFISEHNERLEQELDKSKKAGNREGGNLDRFRRYPTR